MRPNSSERESLRFRPTRAALAPAKPWQQMHAPPTEHEIHLGLKSFLCAGGLRAGLSPNLSLGFGATQKQFTLMRLNSHDSLGGNCSWRRRTRRSLDKGICKGGRVTSLASQDESQNAYDFVFGSVAANAFFCGSGSKRARSPRSLVRS